MATRTKRKATEKAVYSLSSDDDVSPPPKATSPRKGKVQPDGQHPASYHSISRLAAHQSELLKWFDTSKHVRGMPWRKEYDPSLSDDDRAQRAYEVWVSEIMLQQTQVATVIPYYNRWMERFPTMKDLAEADQEDANSIWKGLGYYRRAKLLMEGTKKVVEEFGGKFPKDAKIAWKEVPGVGRYTAGAITSIAYSTKAAAIDGNVQRLLSRLLAIHTNLKSKQAEDVLWSAAEDLVKRVDGPGDWNQALIELGSTVCKPRDPNCGGCPLKTACAAWLETQNVSHSSEQGQLTPPPVKDIEDACKICEPFPPDPRAGVTRYPMSIERKKARDEASAVNVIEWKTADDSWFLLVKRPEKGLLGGLWEFPTVDLAETGPSTDILLKTTHTLIEQLIREVPEPNVSETTLHYASPSQLVGDVRHIFSHIHKTYYALWVVLEGGNAAPALENVPTSVTKKRKLETGADEGLKWVRESDVNDVTMGQGLVKVWQIVQAERTGVAIPEKKKAVSRTKKAKPVVGGDIRQWMKGST
ncbi:DNA glycosylase [Calocera cornea HHB12733]|uniref:Adenine DNA glycosylase n=1 Tax=Calocera cornea HHB12733 TaxID=1353952 RepID=A0A165ECT1_9BASI|nr:DNA glycosylase [Calocera cornea HHB12733]